MESMGCYERASNGRNPMRGKLTKILRYHISIQTTRTIRIHALLILSLIFMPGVVGAVDSFILVSDVDDTVKVTNVLDRDAAARNAVASELVFAGMSELYGGLLGKNSRADRLEFVSGSPRAILSHKVRECLNGAHFPAYNLVLRGRITSAYDFKKNEMEKLYGESDNEFLLIGDDTESDPKVYAHFSSQKSDKVLAIYIHRITGRPLPPAKPSIVLFVTAYDIAMYEYKAGRLNEEQAAAVGEAVLTSEKTAFLPKFQKCPKEYTQVPDLPDSLKELKLKIEERMASLCSSRRPTQALHRTARALYALAAR